MCELKQPVMVSELFSALAHDLGDAETMARAFTLKIRALSNTTNELSRRFEHRERELLEKECRCRCGGELAEKL